MFISSFCLARLYPQGRRIIDITFSRLGAKIIDNPLLRYYIIMEIENVGNNCKKCGFVVVMSHS